MREDKLVEWAEELDRIGDQYSELVDYSDVQTYKAHQLAIDRFASKLRKENHNIDLERAIEEACDTDICEDKTVNQINSVELVYSMENYGSITEWLDEYKTKTVTT